MQAEDLIVDQSGKGKVIEKVGKELPHAGVSVLAQAFVIKAVDLGDLARFMVATKNSDARRVANFEGDQESDGLDRVVAAINIVT